MASEAAHILVANRNHETIKHLCLDVHAHGPWIATVAFYKALHVVEAVFANDPAIQHCHDHQSREQTLKRVRKYQKINQHYGPLLRAALVARYLECNGSPFSSFYDHIPADQIGPQLLLHRLHQVEESAIGFLKGGASLLRATALRPLLTVPSGAKIAAPSGS